MSFGDFKVSSLTFLVNFFITDVCCSGVRVLGVGTRDLAGSDITEVGRPEVLNMEALDPGRPPGGRRFEFVGVVFAMAPAIDMVAPACICEEEAC